MSTKNIFRRVRKMFLYILSFVLFVFIALVGFLHTNYAKELVNEKIQAYLRYKIKTKVVIGSVDYSLPRSIIFKNVYLEDQDNDTLLAGEIVSVELNMLKLFWGETDINKVELKNINANISRRANETDYNFQFLVKAFSGDTTTINPIAKDSIPLKIILKEITLENFNLKFKDEHAGNDFNTTVKQLNATVNTFQPDRLFFAIENLNTSGVDFSMKLYKPENLQPAQYSTTSNNNFRLTANQSDLKNIQVSIKDEADGMFYSNDVHHLTTSSTDINLLLQKVVLGDVIVDSSSAKFIAPVNIPHQLVNVSGKNNDWIVSLKSLQLSNDQFQFDENQSAIQKGGFDPSHLLAKNIHASTGAIFYSPDSMAAMIHQLAFVEKSGLIVDTAHGQLLYGKTGIVATDFYLKTPQSVLQNSFRLYCDDISKLQSNTQNSVVTAMLSHSTIAINDLYTILPSVKEYLPVEKFHDNVIHINSEVKGSLQQLVIPYLQLKGLSGSSINAKAILYNIADAEKMGYDITVYNSHLLKKDVLKFIPYNEYVGELPNDINLNTHIKGNRTKSIFDLDISSTLFKLKGKADIKNINKPEKIQYDISIKEGKVEKSFIEKFIPQNTIPSSIQLPSTILFKGLLKGDMNNVTPDLVISGTYGTVTAKGYVHNFKNTAAANYDMYFTTQNFEVGKLLKQDSVLGNITLSGSAKGTGLDYKTMRSNFDFTIGQVKVKKYDYKNITVVADLNKGKLASAGNVNDSNVQVRFTAAANLSNKYPSDVDMIFLVDTIQLQQLHLYNDTLNASFKTHITAEDLDPRNLNAYILIDSSKLFLNNKHYLLDSIIAKAVAVNGENDVAFRSPLADIFAKGKFDYEQIAQSVIQYIDKHYNIVSTLPEQLPPQQITVEGKIKKHPLMPDLIPGLAYEDIVFDAGYTSNWGDSALKVHAFVPGFSYQTYSVSNGKIDIASLNSEIDYAATFDTLRVNKNTFYATALKGNLINDSLNISALTKDKKNIDQFGIGAAITASNDNYTFSLQKDLLLNYQQWNVSSDNKISYSPQGILVHNFSLENGHSKISANSPENIINSPIDINIEKFDIKDIASIANRDTLLASGIINGKINVSDLDKKLPAFTGNLTVDGLQYMQQPIGDIKFSATNRTENTVAATLELTGNGNNVITKGNYYLNNESDQFDADLDIRRLSMPTLQAFTIGNLTRSSGSLNGNIKLSGSFKEPKWNGAVNFDSAKFTIAKTGAAYSIDQQKIALNYPDINFNNFSIKDSTGNTMTVDGKVIAQSLTDYDFSLALKSRNFTIVNTPKAIDNQIYGFAAITSNVTVSGNMSSPDIEGSVSLTNKSDVTIVLPEQNLDKNAARSVVRFIDRDTFALPEKIAFSPQAEQKSGFAEFLNYNLNITIAKNAALTIIVDPSSGDELKVQGDAQLNAGVDPGGNIVLAGNYALKSGYYILNYQFLQRKFNLLEGSTIAFSGSPMDAQVDITAEYIAYTAAGDLLENEVGQMDASLASMFNQKIPFRVVLYLKGEMKKPVISFDIQLPDESLNVPISNALRTTIENKLTQMRGDAAATNKEVFSLLLLGRFVGEQSSDFFKGNGATIDDVARQSVSKFLSSALNQIAADLFKGIDIDLNLNSYQDFSNGTAQQKTDLNVAVSKNFLNNRLTVTAGKNFGIEGKGEGAKTVQQNTSSFPDLTLNYKLSRDGKYMLKAYKKEQYEVTVDGYVVETGVAFVITLEYDKFKELFHKKKKRTKKSPPIR
ncbi:translocation/assembly module TamB domain-containing protein [Ferruginibacter lapsinanis]|uniref:translocation/assembly module TamB domain-containing protein n=1 Tax=Ferruginibacter lapsinanis TaxID=563172 RepID=UPI001E5BCE3F|nr:translocation/assembly module TamB domain-containing protein [Ferruginibacter lapsinanis]UEG50887.1 translocation/assembly module TamB domain-containing protein [Ferruginibacter lapsinanis]